MLKLAQGNLFDDEGDVRVITVNTVGVMGKGIALQFRQRYPELFKRYRRDCRDGNIQIGQGACYTADDGKWFILLPTKEHWSKPSTPYYISKGLDWLEGLVNTGVIPKGSTILMPPLGCTNGGLNFKPVLTELYLRFAELPVDLHVYYSKQHEFRNMHLLQTSH